MKKQEQVLKALREMGNWEFNGIKFSEMMDNFDFDITNKALLELDRIFIKGDYTEMQVMNILEKL